MANWFEQFGATVGDFFGTITKGALKSLEGIYDFGAGIVGGIGGLFDQGFQDRVREHIEWDATESLSENIHFDELEKKSWLKNAGPMKDILSGIGGMIPSVAVSIIPGVGAVAGTAAMGLGAAGNSTEGALQEGADFGAGLAYGAGSGIIEGATERLGGFVLGGGQGLIGKKLAGTALGRATSKGLGKVALDFASEAGEEVLSDLIDPLNRYITGVDKNIGENYKEAVSNLPKTALVGGTVGSVMQGGTAALNTVRNKRKGRGGFKATSADNSVSYINEMVENYGDNAEQNAKFDEAIRMSLEDISSKITKLDEGSRRNYLESIGSLKNAFDESGNVKQNLSINANSEAVSNSVRAISGGVKYAPVSAGETVSQGAKVAKQTAERVIGKGASVVITNEAVPGDALYNPNDKVIYINNNADLTEDKISKAVALHEVTHITEGTKAYKKLINALEDVINDENAPAEIKAIIDSPNVRLDNIGDRYGEQIDGLNKAQTLFLVESELHADLIGELLGNDYFIEKLAMRDEGLLKKLYHSIKSKANAKKSELGPDGVKYLNKLANKFAKAIDKRAGGVKLSDLANADEEREENANEDATLTDIRYLKPNEKSSIREQLKDNLELVNKMQPVSVVESKQMTRKEMLEFATEEFKKIGYQIERQDLGKIEIGKKEINDSINYLYQPGEILALLTVPKVLKRGLIIDGHDNHKNRNYETITIAAPVVINGTRGNVGVVVKKGGKNKYKTHRILMPDGSEFVFETKKDIEPTSAGVKGENHRQGPAISSMSNNSISENSENVNKNNENNLDERFSKSKKNGFTIARETAMRIAEELIKGYDEGILTAEDATRKLKAIGFVTGVNESTALDILDNQIDEIREFARVEREAYRNDNAEKHRQESFTALMNEKTVEFEALNKQVKDGFEALINFVNREIPVTSEFEDIGSNDEKRKQADYDSMKIIKAKMKESASALDAMIKQQNDSFNALLKATYKDVPVTSEFIDTGSVDTTDLLKAIEEDRLHSLNELLQKEYTEFKTMQERQAEWMDSLINQLSAEETKSLGIQEDNPQILRNMGELAEMECILTVDAKKLEKTGKSPKELYAEFFSSIGNKIQSDRFGNISLPNSSIRSEIRHGTTAEKLATLEAIPEVIERGKVIFDREKEGGVKRLVVCAPINIGRKSYYMGVMLQKDSNHQRLYLHNVVSLEMKREALASEKADLVTTGAQTKDDLSMTIILQNALKVKFAKQKSTSYNSKKMIRSLIEDAVDSYATFNGDGDEVAFMPKDAKQEVVSEIWKRINSTKGYNKKRFVSYISKKIMENIVLGDSGIYKVRDVLKSFMHRIDINDVYDEFEAKQKNKFNSRWALKEGNEVIDFDEVIAEMRSLGYMIESSGKLSALLELNIIYEHTQRYTNEEQGARLAELMGKEKYDEMLSKISKDIYSTLESNQTENELAGKLAYVIEKSQEELKKYREYKKEFAHDEKRETGIGILLYNVTEIMNIKNHKYAKALQVFFDDFLGVQKDIGKLLVRGNINKSSARKIAGSLSSWYTEKNEMLGDYFSQEIANKINNFKSIEGVKGPLSSTEIWDLVQITTHLKNFFKNYGKIWRDGKLVDAKKIAEKQYKIALDAVKSSTPFQNILRRGQYFITPASVAAIWDGHNPDGEFTHFVGSFQKGEVKLSYDKMKISKKIDSFFEKDRKLFDKLVSGKLKVKCGMKIDLRNEKIEDVEIPAVNLISLYLATRTMENDFSLEKSGYALKLDNSGKYTYMAPVTVQAIRTAFESLPGPIKELAMWVQEWNNTEGKRLKYEQDIQLKGTSNILSGDYWHLRRLHTENLNDMQRLFGSRGIGNHSFNKERMQTTTAMLEIGNFIEEFLGHAEELLTYVHIDSTIKNFDKVMQIDISENEQPRTVKMLIDGEKFYHGAFKNSKSAFDYFTKLGLDVVGANKEKDPFNAIVGAMRKGYASFALGANPKVLLTQASSLIAGFGELRTTSVLYGLSSVIKFHKYKELWEETQKYCPWAAVRRYERGVTKAMTLNEKIGKIGGIFSKPIEIMDSFIVMLEFKACQKEIESLYKIPIGTEENKIRAGQLLQEIGLRTQQNQYASTRSAAIRSENEFMKGFTMFKTDSHMVLSGLIQNICAWGVIKKQIKFAREANNDVLVVTLKKRLNQVKLKTAKYTTVVILTCAFMTLLAKLFNKLYKQEEEEEITVGGALKDTFGNFLGMFPIVSEISSKLMDGYDVDNTFYNSLNETLNSVSNVVKIVREALEGKEITNEELMSALRKVLYVSGKMTGVPTKNLEKDAKVLVGWISPTVESNYEYLFQRPSDKSLKEKLSSGIERGDDLLTSNSIDKLLENRDMDLSDNVLKNEISRLIKLDNSKSEGDTASYNPLGSKIPDIVTFDGQEVELSKADKNVFKNGLKSAETDSAKAVKTLMYRKLENESKAYAIRTVYLYHHQASLESITGKRTKLVYFGSVIGINTLSLILAYASQAESDKYKSRKEKIEEYIKKFGLTKAKMSLILRLLGYSDKENDKIVQTLIKAQRTLTEAQRTEFLSLAKIS